MEFLFDLFPKGPESLSLSLSLSLSRAIFQHPMNDPLRTVQKVTAPKVTTAAALPSVVGQLD